jgi:PAS domain S-box-containing protein
MTTSASGPSANPTLKSLSSEQTFSMIFRVSPDAVDITDLEDGTILDLNDSHARMFGYRREEALGGSTCPGALGLWVDPEDRARLVAGLKADGEVIGFEAPMRRRDGSTFTALVSSALLEIDGRPCNLAIIRDISRRKGREEDLLHDRNFTRALLDTMNEGVIACDVRGRLALTNRSLQRWHGPVAKEESLDPWARDQGLCEADGRTPLGTLANPLVRAYMGETFQDAELTLRVPGQRIRRLVANGSPILAEDGRHLGAVAVLHDVTSQRRTDEAMRKISVAVQRNPVGIVVTDAKGTVDFVNPRFTELTGYSATEILGLGWTTLDSERNPPALRTRLLATVRSGGVWKGELVLRRKDGEEVWSAATITPIKGPSGRIENYMAFNEDITSLKLNQQAREESEARFQGLFETSRDGIALVDRDGRYLDGNQAFLDLLGLRTREALVAKSFEDFMSAEDQEQERCLLAHSRRSAETLSFEKVYLREDGSRVPVELRVWSQRDRDGRPTGTWVMARDISERVQAQAQLRRLNEELEMRIRSRTAQLEASNAELDAFSYSVSHDLRAPLRGIDGFSQALLEECSGQLGSEGRHYLQRVRANTARMGQLIDDLLRLSRVSRGDLRRQRLDLSAMARGILEELRQGDPSRPLELRIEDGLAGAGDPGLVRVMLANLLGNAWKYTAKVALARIEFLRDAPSGAYCVRDNGAGFDMAHADKLFGAFQRCHPAEEFEGNGIGLAIVQRIIRRHGGRVWGTGAVGQGASFYFSLPEPDPDNADPEPDRSRLPDGPGDAPDLKGVA